MLLLLSTLYRLCLPRVKIPEQVGIIDVMSGVVSVFGVVLVVVLVSAACEIN